MEPHCLPSTGICRPRPQHRPRNSPAASACASETQPPLRLPHTHWSAAHLLPTRAGGGDSTDLEIQPLRVSVAREAWEGLPGSFTPSEQGEGAAEQQEASRQ